MESASAHREIREEAFAMRSTTGESEAANRILLGENPTARVQGHGDGLDGRFVRGRVSSDLRMRERESLVRECERIYYGSPLLFSVKVSVSILSYYFEWSININIATSSIVLQSYSVM